MAIADMSFLGLNRPQYIPIPELQLAALAWSLDPKGSARNLVIGGGRFDGIAYRQKEIAGSRSAVNIGSTWPKESIEEKNRLAKALERSLQLNPQKASDAADVVLGEIEVIASHGSRRSVASPMTLEAALLQDVVGIAGTKNPPGLAMIIEQFFALGGGQDSAARRWLSAVEGAKGGGVPAWLDEGVKTFAPELVCEVAASIRSGSKDRPPNLRTPVWLAARPISPFRWFAQAWTRLCCDGWIDRMPRRRWTDWATCVLRTALASGYLFEMHLTQRLALALIQKTDPADVVRSAFEDAERIFAWDARRSVSGRDVGPIMGNITATGSACRNLLAELQKANPELPSPGKYDDQSDGLERWIVDARQVIAPIIDDVQRKAASALDSATYKSGTAKNVHETIRYSFLGRDAGQSVDLYGLLSTRGRYSLVDPGQEWLVTVASLTSISPSEPARLATLIGDLRSLGIAVHMQTLVSQLEAYGLARSSHDADEAIEIQPAF